MGLGLVRERRGGGLKARTDEGEERGVARERTGRRGAFQSSPGMVSHPPLAREHAPF